MKSEDPSLMKIREIVFDQDDFFDQGKIVECGTPDDIFHDPKEERTKFFLSQILTH